MMKAFMAVDKYVHFRSTAIHGYYLLLSLGSMMLQLQIYMVPLLCSNSLAITSLNNKQYVENGLRRSAPCS